jgi:hypothetical protein
MNRIEEIFYGYLFSMKNKSIPCSAAYFAISRSVMNVGIFWSKFVPVLAMSARPLISGMRRYRFRQRFFISRIKRLLLACCPTAVRRFVISVVVDAVKRAAFWSWSHVLNKSSEPASSWLQRAPTVANSNPAPTPIFIVFAACVITPLAHMVPTSVERMVINIHGANYSTVVTGG